MSTTQEILSKVVTQNTAVQEDTRKLTRYLIQRGMPNTAYALADQTVAGTTLTASTYMSIVNAVGYNSNSACVGSRSYQIEAYLATSVGASGGIKVALDGGTVVATNVQLTYEHLVVGGSATTDSAALATTAGAATTGVIAVRITGSFTVTGAGSIGLRFSEFAAIATATVKKGSWMRITEIAQ